MKQFLDFIGKILLVLLLSSFALDFSYSYVYSKSTKRNKIENVINSEAKKYDVIMLGSSRANNHFVPQLFIEKGFKAYNYGMSGARLQESALMLQLIIDKGYRFKNIILEIDLNINSEGHSEGTRARFMPFLKSHATVLNYYKNIVPEFSSLYYMPFYRYIQYDSQIGFREMFFSAIQKTSASILNEGFYALKGEGKNMKYDLTKYAPKKNKDYEFIKDICKTNNINLIVVSTPMCSNVKGIDYFNKIKSIYPEVHNYENSIADDKYFSSCGHMNEAGARLFTTKIIEDFFSTKVE
ncbi:hypothetical protein FBBAL38_02475 [Flavobacteria bacterium BAL38]|nr:hypothetical protein FBBAL38_02475 [Flavobacteria bacterium BAL38]